MFLVEMLKRLLQQNRHIPANPHVRFHVRTRSLSGRTTDIAKATFMSRASQHQSCRYPDRVLFHGAPRRGFDAGPERIMVSDSRKRDRRACSPPCG